MENRKPNFIDNLRPDVKSHVVLGTILNPIIYAITLLSIKWFEWFKGDVIIASRYALLFCFLAHLTIELDQYFRKTGQAQLSDLLAGFSTALICMQPIIELLKYLKWN